MRRSFFIPFLASTALVATPAMAQDSEVETLRAQVRALQSQLDALNARLDTVEEQQTTVLAIEQSPATGVAAAPAAPAEEPVAIGFGAAPEFESAAGFTFKPFGRIQADAGTINLPDGLAATDGFSSELRRARIGFEGEIPGGFGYKLEVDFATGAAELTDVFLTYGDGPLTLTAGQHNNFQGLEELTSSRWSSFIERAAFTDAFGFERRLGVSAQYSAGNVLVQAGAFSDNIEDLPGKNSSYDGRIVFAPKLGDNQLHLGGSLHYADLESGQSVRYRQRPLVHFTSDRLINTGNIGAESEFGYGAEAAFIAGPFHAAGEVFWQQVNRPDASLADPTFFGGYAEIGYFITGEKRGYKSFKFDRTRPTRTIDEGGLGAFQVNLRYDYLDLNDAGIIGGVQNGYFASLVWVPTDYTRMMLNYGRLAYDDAVLAVPSGDTSYNADVLAVRAQIDF